MYLILEPSQYFHMRDFTGVIFRRKSTMLTGQGGLWDKAFPIYKSLDGRPRGDILKWKFPSQSTFQFMHMQHEQHRFDHQGNEYAFIGWDELTQFTKRQFLFLLTRNRSTCGIRPYIRATMNPDPDSWVKSDFVLPYLDNEGRYANPDMAGKIRYFFAQGDDVIWGDSKKELIKKYGKEVEEKILSFTFIPAKLSDNQILMDKDPGYKSKILNSGKVEAARLLEGDWLIKEDAGSYFKKSMFLEVDAAPKIVKEIRWWDRAATKPSPSYPDPDYTTSVRLGLGNDGIYYILDLFHARDEAYAIDTAIKVIASQDTQRVQVGAFQDPGAAGKAEAQAFVRMLAGYPVVTESVTVNKETAAKPVASQAQAGNIRVVASIHKEFKDLFYSQLTNFPTGNHDDYVDAFSGAFNALTSAKRPKVS